MTLGISQALAAAAADGSLAGFLSDLASSGGRVVAGMLEGAVEAVVNREKKKKEGGNDSDDGGGEEQDDKSAASASASASAAAAAAAAASHERLHSGPWNAVPSAWRDAFSLACLLQVAESEDGEERGKDSFEARMRLLDLALLLGGRRFRALAHSAAALLSSSPSSPSSSLPEAWTLPETPVELPPGSLGGSERGLRVEESPVPLPLEGFVSRASSAGPRPFLLRGCVSHWPALSEWNSPRYWDRVAGARTVPVEVGSSYLEGGWSQELQTLRAFLDDHMVCSSSPSSTSSPSSSSKKTGYLAQHDLLEQVPDLARDVLTPDYALALSSSSEGGEAAEGGDVARNLWLGPARTLSPLHTDPKRNLLCQVFGRKYVRLYCPAESSGALLAAGREGEEGGGLTDSLTSANTSRADLFDPSESVSSLRFVDTILAPGDALFIPERWWHFVLSLEPSASVSFWF